MDGSHSTCNYSKQNIKAFKKEKWAPETYYLYFSSMNCIWTFVLLCTWGIWQRMPFNSVGCQSVRLPPSGAVFLVSLSVVVLQVSSGWPLFHWPSGVHRKATLGRADGDIQSTHYQSSSIFFIGHKIQRILYNHLSWNPGEFVTSVHLMQA